MTKSTEELFKEFADGENERALQVDLMIRGVGIDDQSQSPTLITFRQLLSDAIRTRIASIIEDVTMESVMTDIGEAIDHTISAAPEIIDRKTPKDRLSMLDAVTLGRVTEDDIDHFLRSNGRDPSREKDINYIYDLMERAIRFFDEYIANGKPANEIHANLRKRKGSKSDRIYRLFQSAAGQHGRFVVPHACALLRIMAVINFIESDPRLSLIPAVRRKLEELKAKHILKAKTSQGTQSFFTTGTPGDDMIELPIYEDRDKTIDSMIIKLLHTPGGRAREIVDQIGTRFIARTPEDVIKLIHRMFFHEHAIFPATNIIIPRGKTRINCTAQTIQEAIFADNREKALEIFDDFSQTVIEDEDMDNTASSSNYRAIHMIFDLPIITETGEHLLFPIEFQFTYLEAYRTNATDAPHEKYREKQVRTVTGRLMNNNLATTFNQGKEKRKKIKKPTS